MPEVEIRPVGKADVASLLEIVPAYQCSRVWQLDRLSDEGVMGANFREVRLPRETRVDYPRSNLQVFNEFQQPHETFLAAFVDGLAVGYIHISDHVAPRIAWVKDCMVREDLRRRGIGSALILAGFDWAAEQGHRRMVVEMQSKNFPAIQLVRRLGFEFSGFSDQYYSNQDIALFFGRPLK